MNLNTFKQTDLGRRIAAIVEDRDNIVGMITLSKEGMPAVQAIDRAIAALGPEVRNNRVKQDIGRWIRTVLSERGWFPLRPGKLPRGRFFTSGMVYAPRS
jgi:hypothetical protein